MLPASIIIPTRNRVSILRLMLGTLERQTLPCDHFEVIVVDDNSTDETIELISGWPGELKVRCLSYPHQNHCVSAIRNLGIQAARGEIVLFLDADIIVCTQYLLEHIELHARSTQPLLVIGYVYGYRHGYAANPECLLELMDWNDVDGSLPELQKKGLWDPREQAYRPVSDDLRTYPAPWRFFWSNAFSLHRKSLEEIGKFDEDFEYLGGEDTEFGYRCFKGGLDFILSRKAWGVHYPHPVETEIRKQVSHRNVETFYRKHPNPEIELYTVTRRNRYNKLLTEIQELTDVEEDLCFDLEPGKKLANLLGPKKGKILLLGKAFPEFIREFQPDVVVDIDQKRLRKTEVFFPELSYIWGLGVHLPFPDNRFAQVIVTGFWLKLSPSILLRVLQETNRIGQRVFYLGNWDAPDINSRNKNKEMDKACKRLGIEYRIVVENKVCEVTSGKERQ